MKLCLKAHRLCQKSLQYYSRGNCKKLLNDYKGAIADFTKAIKYNPNFAEAYFRRADIKIILNDNRGAALDYVKAIELNPELADAFIDGQLKVNENKFRNEEQIFVRAG
jgi:tetratricopeptide (TPR) repeat protein